MTITPELEAMARAICAAAGRDPDLCRDAPIPEWRSYVPHARAALLSLMEPSEAMLHRAFVVMNETPSGTWKRMKAEGQTPRRLFDVKMAPRWRAMIRHVLGEQA